VKYPPLTRDQKRAYKRALERSTRTTKVKARLLKKNGKGLPSPLNISDGEIVVDASSRDQALMTCHLSAFDPERRFKVSHTLRSSGDSWLSKMVEVRVGIWVYDLDGDTGGWVWTPEFTGPIVTVAREGDMVEIDCASKDIDNLPPAHFKRAFSVKRHTKVHKAIKAILRERGEAKFRLKATTKRLKKSKTYPRNENTWPMKAIHSLADMVDDQFFFDGAGVAVTRNKPKNPVWSFRDEDLMDYPSDSLSRADLVNMVVVKGGGERKRVDDQKRPPTATRQLKRGHPLSSYAMTDGKRPLILFRTFDNIRKRSVLKQRAKDILKRKAHLDQELAFSVRYIPGLEPLDVVKVRGKRVRLRRFTKPLNLDGAMEINWTGNRVPMVRRGK
jgi:hypothetical protein